MWERWPERRGFRARWPPHAGSTEIRPRRAETHPIFTYRRFGEGREGRTHTGCVARIDRARENFEPLLHVLRQDLERTQLLLEELRGEAGERDGRRSRVGAGYDTHDV